MRIGASACYRVVKDIDDHQADHHERTEPLGARTAPPADGSEREDGEIL